MTLYASLADIHDKAFLLYLEQLVVLSAEKISTVFL